MIKDPDAVFDNIYDRVDAGNDAVGSVYDDIAGMTMDEMWDYFGDLDPAEFL
jgi:hypothetical protein